MMRKMCVTGVLAAAALVLVGCDNLTERDENVIVTLDTFNLVGSGGNSNRRAVVTGNPACTASMTSLNSLLAQTSNYDEISKYLESLDINSVEYRITTNNTPVTTTGAMQMTDPATGELKKVASVSIPATSLVNDWTLFPFEDGGAAIVQHYMDDLNDDFLYCAEASPNDASLSLGLELRLNLNVRIDLL